MAQFEPAPYNGGDQGTQFGAARAEARALQPKPPARAEARALYSAGDQDAQFKPASFTRGLKPAPYNGGHPAADRALHQTSCGGSSLRGRADGATLRG